MQQLQVMLRWFSSRRSRDVACNVVSRQHVWALSREDGCVMVFPSSRQMSSHIVFVEFMRRLKPLAAPRLAATLRIPGYSSSRIRLAECRLPIVTNKEQCTTCVVDSWDMSFSSCFFRRLLCLCC